MGYFFILGLAFLFIEIAFIQKLLLFLHHPLYAVAWYSAVFWCFRGWAVPGWDVLPAGDRGRLLDSCRRRHCGARHGYLLWSTPCCDQLATLPDICAS